MNDKILVASTFDSLEIIEKAKAKILEKIDKSWWYFMFGKWEEDCKKLEKVQSYLVDTYLSNLNWNPYKR